MHTKIALLSVLCAAASALPWPRAEGPGPIGPGPIGPIDVALPRQGAAYDKDQYFQYVNVPEYGAFEWGYRRGNPYHNREEYLSQKNWNFKAKVKWHDHDGRGEHFYDYNHGNNHHQDYKEPVYEAPKPVYGAPH